MARGDFTITGKVSETHPATSLTIFGDGTVRVSLFRVGAAPLELEGRVSDPPAGSWANTLKWWRDQCLAANGVATS